jgi:hypothetical protein
MILEALGFIGSVYPTLLTLLRWLEEAMNSNLPNHYQSGNW